MDDSFDSVNDVKNLDEMTVRELREFRDKVDSAIRSIIARQRVERERGEGKSAEPELPTVDLEHEATVWASRRKF